MPDYFNEMLEKAKKKKKALAPESKPLEEALSSEKLGEEQLAGKLEELKAPEEAPKKTEKSKLHWIVEGKREEAEKKPEKETRKRKIIDTYGEVTIFEVEGTDLLHYEVPVPKPTSGEKAVINAIKEAATRLISIAPYRIRDPEQKRNVYYQKILEILRTNPELNIPSNRFDFYAKAVVREMVGYGIIDPLIRDDLLEEIMITGAKRIVYVFHREHEMMTTNIEFYSENEIQDLINRIAREVGRRVDISSPLLDARLPDGSRVNATIPPASVDQSSLTIRKFRKEPYSIVDLILLKTINPETAAFLWLCVEGLGAKPANLLISGGTGSGKTSTLNALAALIPERERIVTIEDTAELSLPLDHWIRLEARPPGLEGTGELTMDILTKNALRMRPDRIIVGEVRHAEAFTLFTALNTGHDGMASHDSLIQLANGSIKELGEFCEEYFAKLPPKRIKNLEVVELKSEKPEIVAISKQNLLQQTTTVKSIWRRPCKKSFMVKLASGRTITLSHDHPVFRLKNGFVEQVQCKECEPNDYLCAINQLGITGKKFSKDCAYFLGLLLGDGHLEPGLVSFENKNKKLHALFRKLTRKLFGKKAKTRASKSHTTSSLFSTKVANEINEKFSVPFGNKTKIFNVPKAIEESSNESVGFFLRGMFDTDGHVSDIRKSVSLATSNPRVAKKIPLLLKRFGIESRKYQQEKDGRGHVGPYYRIFITGEENLQKFKRNIGFGHPKKARSLATIVGVEENTNIDVVPNAGMLTKKIRTALKISKRQLAMKTGLGNTGATINAHETGTRHPSRKTLKKINRSLTTEFNKQIRELAVKKMEKRIKTIIKASNKKAIQTAFDFARRFSTIENLQHQSGLDNKILYYYKKTNTPFDRQKLALVVDGITNERLQELAGIRKLITHINSLTSKNIRWDKIVRISEKSEKTNYYDLTLDQFNTFVANGIVVSNCAGTIHANSPEETIVRVTNPPMNVPLPMLAALDLIIVENRLHDKKKGTIRRVTEIAQLEGILEGKPVARNIFERNPITDQLERTLVGIEYIKKVQKLTGTDKKQIELEWKRRERFLENLANKNIRGIKKARFETNQFLKNR